MKTNSLQDVKRVKTRYKHIGTYKPYTKTGITRGFVKSDLDVAICHHTNIKVIMDRYHELLQKRKEKLDLYMIDLYGKPIKISEKGVSAALKKIDQIFDETHLHLEDLGNMIRSYVNHEVDLPLSSDKILQAYRAIQASEPANNVKQILIS